MPDQDQFARATSKARAAFRVVCDESDRAPELPSVQVDLTALAAWIGNLFTVCGGLPSFVPVLAAVRKLADEPLFARNPETCERVLDEVDTAVDARGQTDLDLVLRRAATREVLAGRYSEIDIAERFFRDMITRYAIDAKKGLVDRIPEQVLSRERSRIEKDMLPVVRDAAALLVRNPGLQRLQLAALHRPDGDIATANLITEGFFSAAIA